MDKYDGIINKPEIEEVLYHAGFHKYIDKYLGKNGKWIYKYAGQAKNAATGAINKAKTMLPGLQKQATGAVTTAKKKASSLASAGSKAASGAKKQAQSRINKMLPILSKKLNQTKKHARSQAAGVKLVARDKTKKLKKQADGTYKDLKSKAVQTKQKIKNKVTPKSVRKENYNARKIAEDLDNKRRIKGEYARLYDTTPQVHNTDVSRKNARKYGYKVSTRVKNPYGGYDVRTTSVSRYDKAASDIRRRKSANKKKRR